MKAEGTRHYLGRARSGCTDLCKSQNTGSMMSSYRRLAFAGEGLPRTGFLCDLRKWVMKLPGRSVYTGAEVGVDAFSVELNYFSNILTMLSSDST